MRSRLKWITPLAAAAFLALGLAAAPGSTAKAVTNPDPSGVAMPVGNLPGWTQVFADNFATDNVPVGGFPADVSSTWYDYPDGWTDTAGNGYYEPSETMSITGGEMNMFIHTDSEGRPVTAVPEPLLSNRNSDNGQLYGMYSVRMRSDAVPGYVAAFLLWPDSENWPQDGEIDFPNGELDGNVNAFMHYEGGTSGSSQDAYSSTAKFTDWHTYTMEWTPSSVEFLIDGTVIGDSTNPSLIPDTPMHWVFQTETDTDGVTPSPAAQGNLQVDWATAYSYTPGSPGSGGGTTVTLSHGAAQSVSATRENVTWDQSAPSWDQLTINGPGFSNQVGYVNVTGASGEGVYTGLESGHTYTVTIQPEVSQGGAADGSPGRIVFVTT